MHSGDYRVTEGNEQGYAGIMGHLIIPLPYLDVRLNRWQAQVFTTMTLIGTHRCLKKVRRIFCELFKLNELCLNNLS